MKWATLKAALEAPLAIGTDVYLMPSAWVEDLKSRIALVAGDDKIEVDTTAVPAVSAIDTTVFFTDAAEAEQVSSEDWYKQSDLLKPHLAEDLTFLPSEEVWQALVKDHGLKGPALRRAVVAMNGQPFVEVHPIKFKLIPYSATTASPFARMSAGYRTLTVSRGLSNVDLMAKVDELIPQMFRAVAETSVASAFRLWKAPYGVVDELVPGQTAMEDPPLSVGAWCAGVDTLMVERQDEAGKWPSEEVQETYLHATASRTTLNGFDDREHPPSKTIKASHKRGICGLQNLGNTCFMNSALQCLSNTDALTAYFISDAYREDVNASNPLGQGGRVASAYAQLMKQMWSGHQTSVVPRVLKRVIGDAFPQFVGYQQQDSQELLSQLLDVLHEDLNRIVKKPYVERPDWDGTVPTTDETTGVTLSDVEVAQKKAEKEKAIADLSWEGYLKRNSSKIVDLFGGLARNELICPECNKCSIVFDPFLTLSLPLPQERSVPVIFVPMTSTIATPHGPEAVPDRNPIVNDYNGVVRLDVNVDGSPSFRDTLEQLAELVQTEPTQIKVVEVYNAKVLKTFTDSDTFADIADGDTIVAYQLEPVSGMTVDLSLILGRYTTSAYGNLFPASQMPVPIVARFSAAPMSVDAIYEAVSQVLSAWTDLSMLDETQVVDVDANAATTPSRPYKFTLRNLDELLLDGQVTLVDDGVLDIDFGSHYDTIWPTSKLQHAWSSFSMPSRFQRGGSTKKLKLDACLKEFGKSEQLGVGDSWYCPNCKEHRQAIKKYDVWSLPDYVVIQLKRFSQARMNRQKVSVGIEFPIDDLFDFSPYVRGPTDQSLLYKLYAVDNHFGSLYSGHYTAHARNPIDGEWYNFDDSSASSCGPSQISPDAAYLLFFKRMRADGTESKTEMPAVSSPVLPPASSTPLFEAATSLSAGSLTLPDFSIPRPVPSSMVSFQPDTVRDIQMSVRRTTPTLLSSSHMSISPNGSTAVSPPLSASREDVLQDVSMPDAPADTDMVDLDRFSSTPPELPSYNAEETPSAMVEGDFLPSEFIGQSSPATSPIDVEPSPTESSKSTTKPRPIAPSNFYGS